MIRANLLQSSAPDVLTQSGSQSGSKTYTFLKDYAEVYAFVGSVFTGGASIQGDISCAYSGTGTAEDIVKYLPSSGTRYNCFDYKHITNVKAGDTITLTALQAGSGTSTTTFEIIAW